MPVGIARLNEVCVLLWSVIISILLTFAIIPRKSSDLFMINPHISLNPQNSWISSAIIRFHEDFHCEIHGFHEQSSDLDLNPCQIWGLFHLLCLRASVMIRGCLLHNLCWSHFLLRCNVMCSIWELDLSDHNIDHRSEHRSICICLFQI